MLKGFLSISSINRITTIRIGIIINSFTILVPSNTINAFPVVILIHNVFNPILEIPVTKTTAIINLIGGTYEKQYFLYISAYTCRYNLPYKSYTFHCN